MSEYQNTPCDAGDGYASCQMIDGVCAQCGRMEPRMPGDWFKDSSLKTWFPMTAEWVEEAKAKLQALRKERDDLRRYIDTDESSKEFQEIARHRDHLVKQNAELLGDCLTLRTAGQRKDEQIQDLAKQLGRLEEYCEQRVNALGQQIRDNQELRGRLEVLEEACLTERDAAEQMEMVANEICKERDWAMQLLTWAINWGINGARFYDASQATKTGDEIREFLRAAGARSRMVKAPPLSGSRLPPTTHPSSRPWNLERSSRLRVGSPDGPPRRYEPETFYEEKT